MLKNDMLYNLQQITMLNTEAFQNAPHISMAFSGTETFLFWLKFHAEKDKEIIKIIKEYNKKDFTIGILHEARIEDRIHAMTGVKCDVTLVRDKITEPLKLSLGVNVNCEHRVPSVYGDLQSKPKVFQNPTLSKAVDWIMESFAVN